MNTENKILGKRLRQFLHKKQDAVGAYIWAWSYDAYDTLNMPYCS